MIQSYPDTPALQLHVVPANEEEVIFVRSGEITATTRSEWKQELGRLFYAGATSAQLQFSEMPLVTFHKTGNQTEAEIVFDRQWRINKAQKVTEGKASTALRLRREVQGWRIISERQVRTYFNHTKKASGR